MPQLAVLLSWPSWCSSPEWWVVIVAALTAMAIAYQAREMRRTTEVMSGQLKTMQEQLKEMGAQTCVLEKSVDHAEKSAEAAKKSADALINSERAWVMVDVHFTPGEGFAVEYTSGETYRTFATLELEYSNVGKSPAWITEKRARFQIVKDLPPQPDLDLAEFTRTEPEPLAATGDPSTTRWETECSGKHGPHTLTVVYGVVKYRDIFGENRETRFGYYATVDNIFKRLSGYPEYNKHT
jgi:hypothetical protein